MVKSPKFSINIKFIVLSLLIVISFSDCQFIRNTFTYKNTTTEFVEDLLHKDYDKCLDLMFLDSIRAKGISQDTLKSKLVNVGSAISDKFGNDLQYSFIKSEKIFSTNEKENTPDNSTKFYLQISNGKDYGIIYALYDDNSKKILEINFFNEKNPIPNMTKFWLFGLLALCIPAFNIYTIVKIKRSLLKGKWLMYLAIILINVPTISYSPVNGLSFELLSFQGLLGVNFSYYGYLGAVWEFGLPLGGIFCLWRLMAKKAGPEEQEEIILENNVVEEENNEITGEQITE